VAGQYSKLGETTFFALSLCRSLLVGLGCAVAVRFIFATFFILFGEWF